MFCEDNLSEFLQLYSLYYNGLNEPYFVDNVRVFCAGSIQYMVRCLYLATELIVSNPDHHPKNPDPPCIILSTPCTPAILFTKLRCFSNVSINPNLPCGHCRQNLVPNQAEIDKAFPLCFASLAAPHRTRELQEAEVLQEKKYVIS